MNKKTVVKNPNEENNNSSNLSRRKFIKTFTGAGLVATNFLFSKNLNNNKFLNNHRQQLDKNMNYRKMGKTGFKISEISLGGSPVPSEAVFKKAMELGVNYVDTSSSYMNGNSERRIGKMVQGNRDKLHIATKFHPGRWYKTKEELIQEVEGSLKRLNTDYIDILLVHGASDPDILQKDYVLEAYEKLKNQGKIRFSGVSCHKDPVNILIPAIKTGHYDMISVAYNVYSGTKIEDGIIYKDYLKDSGIEKVINEASAHNVGVIAMKVMAGGERQDLSVFKDKTTSIPQAKIKWVLKNPKVSAVISEMVTFKILFENIAVSGSKFSPKEEKTLYQYVKKTSDNYCRMCGTCTESCPLDIYIPDILRYFLYYKSYNKLKEAKLAYKNLPDKNKVSSCIECRECERKCPYGISILKNLKTAERYLS